MTPLCKPLLTAALLSLCAGQATLASAEGPTSASDYSSAYTTCMDSNSSTTGMVSCAADETKRQDARLNANYQAGMKTLEGTKRTAMRDAQRLWIQFRDADCAVEAGLTGGTLDRINAQMCLLKATKVRADTLAVRFQPQDL
ncbi:lysozyme inhibitor LprI family protein [Pseudomonas coleopterorum]|uniref:Lysozyme inhibitor LprI family protein n=1 Tax=Pseudomonas coleopterorum TaxID=1605838 RepID=A0AAJ6MS66_9PSED|nr:lysozyme inhibitor LprI family protein [Pseudomonas coleopterorum]WNC08320.1 lysozyme inhibitor LprI family protein [Pseudomonas coleopterorum]